MMLDGKILCHNYNCRITSAMLQLADLETRLICQTTVSRSRRSFYIWQNHSQINKQFLEDFLMPVSSGWLHVTLSQDDYLCALSFILFIWLLFCFQPCNLSQWCNHAHRSLHLHKGVHCYHSWPNSESKTQVLITWNFGLKTRKMHGNPLSVQLSPPISSWNLCVSVCGFVLQATQSMEVSLGTFHPSDITNSLTSLTLQSRTQAKSKPDWHKRSSKTGMIRLKQVYWRSESLWVGFYVYVYCAYFLTFLLSLTLRHYYITSAVKVLQWYSGHLFQIISNWNESQGQNLFIARHTDIASTDIRPSHTQL